MMLAGILRQPLGFAQSIWSGGVVRVEDVHQQALTLYTHHQKVRIEGPRDVLVAPGDTECRLVVRVCWVPEPRDNLGLGQLFVKGRALPR